MKRWQHLNGAALAVIADLVVKTVFATLPELIDNPEQGYPQALSARDKITQQLRFIFVGARHWQGLGNPG
ncbi:hypothetical protein D3C81_1620380 [compost metagenome]